MHFLNQHNNDGDIKYISGLINKCDTIKCESVTRYYKSNKYLINNITVRRDSFTFISNIFDKIHCYLNHFKKNVRRLNECSFTAMNKENALQLNPMHFDSKIDQLKSKGYTLNEAITCMTAANNNSYLAEQFLIEVCSMFYC